VVFLPPILMPMSAKRYTASIFLNVKTTNNLRGREFSITKSSFEIPFFANLPTLYRGDERVFWRAGGVTMTSCALVGGMAFAAGTALGICCAVAADLPLADHDGSSLQIKDEGLDRNRRSM